MKAHEIAQHLQKPARCGNGWSAHKDTKPSLTLTDSPTGKVLVCCHSGCSQEAVIEALKALGLWEPELQQKRVVVAEYNYHSAEGSLVFQVCRTEPKGFFQRKPDGFDGWINRGPTDEEKVLYRLPEVLEASIAFVVEGEKDVEKLRSYGFVATTNAGGPDAKWLPQYTKALRGKEVIVIPDRDEAGFARAYRIVRALHAAVERLVYLDLNEGKDVTEWFETHSETELLAHLEEGLCETRQGF